MQSSSVRRFLGLSAATLALLLAADASAKSAPKKDDDTEETSDKKPTKKSDKDAKADKDADEKDADEKDEASSKKAKSPAKKGDDDADDEDDKDAKKKAELPHSAAFEKEGKDYYFVGLRYRHTLLPKFILSIFAAGGPTLVSVPGFGVEVSKRRDGFEMIGALTYVDYSMKPFPFKGKNEVDQAYEIVESKLKMINATADFLWSSKIAGDQLSFLYGLTAGLGIVWGDLYRTQATPPNGSSPGDPYTYVPCVAPGNPNSQYCANDNSHYPGYSEPSWAGGGYRPIIYPTFGLQMGLRWKPVKEFAARLDVGFNLFSGFFFGLGGDYGI
jgi:hypothetical protein